MDTGRHLSLVPDAGPGSLRHRLLARCHFPEPGTPVDCAVSGGADSLALLVLAATRGCDVTAWHVDHGLRADSAAEADVVAAAAARYGAGFRSITLTLESGPNLEDRARRARFAALPPGVHTGHTADDQAETILLALLRGAGLDGLTGMGPGDQPPGGQPPGATRHPLLALRRADTVALCADEGLTPVRDPTNTDSAMRRNRIRAELIPLVCDIAGRDVVPLLVRTAALLRADAEVLAEAAGSVDPTDAVALAAAPPGTARRAIRAWLAAAPPTAAPPTGAPPTATPPTAAPTPYPPTAAAVERILAVARGEAIACEVAGVGRVARHHQRLVIEEPANAATDTTTGAGGGVGVRRGHVPR